MNGSITIPKPCHENWNKMTPDEKGRHCAVCSKVVTDFTHMKTEEIIESLQSSTSEVCGRINILQLEPVNKKQQFLFWVRGTFIPKTIYTVMAIFGLAAFFKKSAWSQSLPGQIMVNGRTSCTPEVNDNKHLKVKVVNQHQQPITNAEVILKNYETPYTSMITNHNGVVDFGLNSKEIDLNHINIEVNAPGYNQKVIQNISLTKDNQTIQVTLGEEIMLLGEMMFVPEKTSVIESSLEDSLHNISDPKNQFETDLIFPDPVGIELIDLDNNSLDSLNATSTGDNTSTFHFNAYPNPTEGILNISADLDEKFSLQLFDLKAALLFTEINIGRQHSLDLSPFNSGTYYLVITAKGIRETKKIILTR